MYDIGVQIRKSVKRRELALNEILKVGINEMPNMKFECSCGRAHHFNMSAMSIGKDVISDICKMARPFKDGKILVVFDNNTYKVAGDKGVAEKIAQKITNEIYN